MDENVFTVTSVILDGAKDELDTYQGRFQECNLWQFKYFSPLLGKIKSPDLCSSTPAKGEQDQQVCLSIDEKLPGAFLCNKALVRKCSKVGMQQDLVNTSSLWVPKVDDLRNWILDQVVWIHCRTSAL
jgi:hypothetical protein